MRIYASDGCAIIHGSSDPITNAALWTFIVANIAFADRVYETDKNNCDATMNTDYRTAIKPNDKSPLQSICEMLE